MAYIKADKLGRIYAIVEKKDSNTTPPMFKATLNMFRGRQLKSNLKECLNYLYTSIAAQDGSKEAQKELEAIHYRWNNNYEG